MSLNANAALVLRARHAAFEISNNVRHCVSQYLLIFSLINQILEGSMSPHKCIGSTIPDQTPLVTSTGDVWAGD